MTDAGGFASGADNVSTLSQLTTGMKYGGKGYAWTEEEDDALLKGVGKYGVDWK